MCGVMAEINVGDVLRIGATWTLENNFEITNVWHAEVSGGNPTTYAGATQDIQDYMEEIYTELLPEMSDDMDTDFLTLSNLTEDTTFGAIAWGNPLAGANVNQVTAPGVCLFTWARTLKPRVQMRKYFGAYGNSSLTDGEWGAAARADASDAMSIHVLPWQTGAVIELTGVAYNRTLGTFVTGISVATALEPGYQRRRRRGRGS